MKNLKNIITTAIFTLILCISFNVNAQLAKTGPIVLDPGNSTYPENRVNAKADTGFWDTLLVDAGGALGGAGSVASIIGTATGGAAALTPVGWGAVALGGIVGGASASIAYSRTAPLTDTKDPNIKSRVAKEDDEIGTSHNQIIIDFHQTNSTYKTTNTFDKDAFYQFAIASKKNTMEAPLLSKKDYDKIINQSSALKDKDISEVLNYIDGYLPKSIDKANFKKSLLSISSSKNFNDLMINIESLENRIKSQRLSKLDAYLMNAFFSTMRHSAILW